MTGTLIEAVRHDLQQLVHDLGVYLTSVRGGTVAHNQELAAEYLVKVMNAQTDVDDTVTTRLLSGARAYAENKA